MTNAKTMIAVNGVRYRYEDAYRLGLIEEGTPVQEAGVRHPARTDAPDGLITTGTASLAADDQDADDDANNGGQPPERPSKTEEELDGLKRDDIAALFPAE